MRVHCIEVVKRAALLHVHGTVCEGGGGVKFKKHKATYPLIRTKHFIALILENNSFLWIFFLGWCCSSGDGTRGVGGGMVQPQSADLASRQGRLTVPHRSLTKYRMSSSMA